MCSRKKGGEWILSDGANPYLPKFNNLGYKCFQKKKSIEKQNTGKKIAKGVKGD